MIFAQGCLPKAWCVVEAVSDLHELSTSNWPTECSAEHVNKLRTQLLLIEVAVLIVLNYYYTSARDTFSVLSVSSNQRPSA
jgi:hypothetical protein